MQSNGATPSVVMDVVQRIEKYSDKGLIYEKSYYVQMAFSSTSTKTASFRF